MPARRMIAPPIVLATGARWLNRVVMAMSVMRRRCPRQLRAVDSRRHLLRQLSRRRVGAGTVVLPCRSATWIWNNAPRRYREIAVRPALAKRLAQPIGRPVIAGYRKRRRSRSRAQASREGAIAGKVCDIVSTQNSDSRCRTGQQAQAVGIYGRHFSGTEAKKPS